MALSNILWPLVLLAAYATFVWYLWRETGSSWTIPKTIRVVRHSDTPERVLFVCTHNSARSQIAEAVLRHAAGSRFIVASAGTEPTRVHPLAGQVMAECGLSLSTHRTKSLASVGTSWDYVITLCEAAYEQCFEFPVKTSRLHWSVEDPSRATHDPEEQLIAFRRVRDELSVRILNWLSDLAERP